MPPAAWPDDPLPELARRAALRPAIVLDDDPTGTQTVRDLPVLTEWDGERIGRHLAAGAAAVFLSTNSRALDEADAVTVTRDAVLAARAASERTGRPISVVSRSDSTLRGSDMDRHDDLVRDGLRDLLGWADAIVLAQASMARVVETLTAAERRTPILSSPRLGVERVRALLSHR